MLAVKIGAIVFAVVFFIVVVIRSAAKEYARIVHKELLGEDDE